MMGKNKKGQLVFEFVVAAVFLFYIVFYVINYLNTTAVVFANDFYTNSLEYKALHTSELLLRNRGVWNGNVPEAMGLADEWPVLNATKIQYMDTYCTAPANYQTILRKLDINASTGNGVNIEINDTNGYLMKCGNIPTDAMGRTITNARIDRFALSDSDEYLTITVWVW
jgi:hypothetical protein